LPFETGPGRTAYGVHPAPDRRRPIPGELIPITLFLVGGLVGLAFSPIGRAIARRLGGEDPSELKALQAEIDGLRQELSEVRGELLRQVEDANSRLDFAERVIAQSRPNGTLPAGEA
jgi:hypothetical protein